MKIHPQAIESLKRYKADVKAGHTKSAEYWRGQAAAYFTANPKIMCQCEHSSHQHPCEKVGKPVIIDGEKYYICSKCLKHISYYEKLNNPEQPPKKWWDMMFKKMNQEYIGTKEEISQVVGSIWAKFTPKTKEAILVKYENPLIVVDSFYDIKEAKSLVSKLKLKGQKAKIHIKNRYVYPVYTVLTDVKNNPIQHGKCPAHGNKIEFTNGAKKVFCNPGKHWLDISRSNPKIEKLQSFDFEAYFDKNDRFEGMSIPIIVRKLNQDFHNDKAAITAFGNFFVKKGIREGWFRAEFGMSNAEAKKGLKEGWLLPELGFGE